VEGDLPDPMATPAHRIAFDIVRLNRLAVLSTQDAFDVACTMAERRIVKSCLPAAEQRLPVSLKKDAFSKTTPMEMPPYC
jgi:hypothetical protein